jgi:5-methylcytosine-specific restriction protein A
MPGKAKQFRTRPAPSPTPRGTTAERGYGGRWQRFRKVYLSAHPLCELCGEAGRVCGAEHVHHKDWKGPLGDRGYDESNLQPLCSSCHNRISAKNK